MYIVFPGTSTGADRVIPQGNREEYAAVVCVNILECCESVPMDNLLSARLFALRDIPEEKRDYAQIRRFAYEVSRKLQECYCLF